MRKWLLSLGALLLTSVASAQPTPWPNQCPTGTQPTAIGCQPKAAALVGTDLVLGWQIGQSPSTRAMQIDQIKSYLVSSNVWLPLTGGILSGTLQIGTLSGDPPPPTSLTVSGRAWFGAATNRTGGHTWIGDHIDAGYFDTLSQVQSIVSPGTNNGIGLLGAVRSSDVNVPGSPGFGGEAIASFTVNDYVGVAPAPLVKGMWNLYLHGERKPNTGGLLGIEIDIANQGGLVPINSYNLPNTGGITSAIWLGSCGESCDGAGAGSANPMSSYIAFLNNGATGGGADKGLVIVAGAVSGSDFTTTPGISKAIELPQNAQISWTADGTGRSYSYVRGNGTTFSTGLLFDNGGANFTNSTTHTTRVRITPQGLVRIGADADAQLDFFGQAGGPNGFFVMQRRATFPGPIAMKADSFRFGLDTANSLTVTPGVGASDPIVFTSAAGGGINLAPTTTIGNAATPIATFFPGDHIVLGSPVNSALFIFPALGNPAGRFSFQRVVPGGIDFKANDIRLGTVTSNIMTITPGATFADPAIISQDGNGGIAFNMAVYPGNPVSAVTITSSAAVPVSTTAPIGAVHFRSGSATGSHVYIHQGGGVWTPIPGV